MDASVVLRLLPAAGIAALVAWRTGGPWRITFGRAVDEVLRALIVGVVAARLAWLVTEGSWRTVLSTALLVRAGVTTWVGVLAAALWVAWRSDPDRRAWLLVAGPAAGLAGVAVWHAGCGLEGVCAGRPASWGVALPGYVSQVVPLGYLLAVMAAVLATVAWRARCRPAIAVGAIVAYAVGRALLGLLESTLSGYPTMDQVTALGAAAAFALAAWRLRQERPCPS